MSEKALKFNPRISAFLSLPMFISEQWGLARLMNYFEEIELASDGGGEALRRIWEQQKEAAKMRLIVPSTDYQAEMNLESGFDNPNAIAVVNLLGTMRSEDGLSSQGIDHLCNDTIKAGNSKVRGIIVRTSSGGGAVEAAQRFYSTLKEVGIKKPIVQFVDTLSASGAVFSGVACDSIIANGKTASLGSIGVVMQFPKWWVEMMKEGVISIYASQSPDKHDLLKNLISENYAAIQSEHLNPYAEEFQKLVRKERPGVDASALTGKMYIAGDAKKLGLIDKIGTMQTAINEVIRLSRARNRNSNARKAAQLVKF